MSFNQFEPRTRLKSYKFQIIDFKFPCYRPLKLMSGYVQMLKALG